MTRRIVAELLGSGLLALAVVGSGIMATSLTADVGLQLFINAFATALALPVLILVFAPVSGAHFNPVVSLVDSAIGLRAWRDAAAYIPTQIIGCLGGTILANIIFDAPPVELSSTDRLTPAHALAEVVAAAGLVLVIFALARSGRAPVIPWAVGAYIGTAYFFTSSTSFANPAITVGRMVTDSFAGIAPSSVLGFIAAQLVGGALGFVLVRWLYPRVTTDG